jgi:hypothetical protein
MAGQKYKQPNFYTARHTTSEQKQDHIDSLLENETKRNKSDPWNKLGKTSKLKVIHDFVDDELTRLHNLTAAEAAEVKVYLSQCLDKKRMQHVKDVVYNKELGKLTTIHQLLFNTGIRKFSLKRVDKEKEKRTTVKAKPVTACTVKATTSATKRKRIEPVVALAAEQPEPVALAAEQPEPTAEPEQPEPAAEPEQPEPAAEQQEPTCTDGKAIVLLNCLQL